MRQDKLSKQNVILYLCGIIPVVWLGLLIAPCLKDGLPGLVQQFGSVMQNPFQIQLCEDSVKTVLTLLLVYGIAIGVYLSTEHNYRRREEHGSAKWGAAGSVNKKYANKDKTENKLLTQNVAIGLDGRKHRRNLNVLVCGGSGAGKTRFYAKPNIMNANTSFVVLDPKGELLRDTGHLLEEKGYAPVVYRFFCLQSHYRKSLVFTWENLDNAVAAYNKLIAKIANIKDEGGVDEAVRAEYRAKFMKEMDNDLNTAMGVTALYDVLKAKTTGATKLAIIGDYDTVLSLDLLKKAEAEREKKEKAASQQSAGGFTVVSEDGTADEGIENLIRQRAEAKKAKNFAEADRIRDELKAQGVEVTDMPGGAKWKRV